MRLAAGTIFFNDAKGLERTLSSLKDFDEIICVDGRFHDYPDSDDLSTDGSRDIVRAFPNARLYDAPDLPEPKKRDVYLENCTSDALLMIDTDEWLEGDVAKFKENIVNRKPADQLFYQIKWWSEATGGYSTAPRLYINPKELRHGALHCSFMLNGRDFRLHARTHNIIEGIEIRSDPKLRSADRIERSRQYHEWLAKYEHPIKERIAYVLS